MVRYIGLAIALIALISCEKPTEQNPVSIEGKWNLKQVELYENEILNGSNSPECTTSYQFEKSENNMSRLIISEDGQEEFHTYQFIPETNTLIIGESQTYKIDLLNETHLIFYIDYQPYHSRYTFQKVE